jgi:hypothetical protein
MVQSAIGLGPPLLLRSCSSQEKMEQEGKLGWLMSARERGSQALRTLLGKNPK